MTAGGPGTYHPAMHRTARPIAVASLAAVTLLACGRDEPAPGAGRGYLASLPIQTVGGKVDFGAVSPCGGSVSKTVRVRNQSKETVAIRAYSPNCACLTADFLGDRTLGPGDEREVKLTVHPSGHGHRSVSVEFGGDGGFLGSIRVDYSLNSGVATAPATHQMLVGERPQAIEVDVFATDGGNVKVLGIEPPVGTVEVAEGARAKVVLSTAEAIAFAESAEGKAHPGTILGADGAVLGLKVQISTDHPKCPAAAFEFSFVR